MANRRRAVERPQYTINLPERLRATLQRIADDEGSHISCVIRRGCYELVARHERARRRQEQVDGHAA